MARSAAVETYYRGRLSSDPRHPNEGRDALVRLDPWDTKRSHCDLSNRRNFLPFPDLDLAPNQARPWDHPANPGAYPDIQAPSDHLDTKRFLEESLLPSDR